MEQGKIFLFIPPHSKLTWPTKSTYLLVLLSSTADVRKGVGEDRMWPVLLYARIQRNHKFAYFVRSTKSDG